MKRRDYSQPGERLVLIFLICVISVAVITGIAVWQSVRPSEGRPYERLSREEALRYMSFENKYTIVDVRTEDLFEEGHLEEAINIPYDSIVASSYDLLPDLKSTVYVYGTTEKESCAAAQKLSDMGYSSISEIGAYSDWIELQSETDGQERELLLNGALAEKIP